MRAYYNEIDPKAAAWLRELIARGLIADGDVDETDIRDVDPTRLGGYTQCHFFAGIGGWSHALRLAGWPDDKPVWTGSCPCQPFSAAGRREGVADERHLWPHWHHLISVCRPSVVFGEQVASKDGLGWLDLVCADLEGSGYAVGAADLCAAGIGAPHIRQRLWFVGMADAEHAERWKISEHRKDGRDGSDIRRQEAYGNAGARSEVHGLADASGEHLWRGLGQGDGSSGTAKGAAWERQRGGDDDGRSRANGGLADADGAGRLARQRDDQTARHGHTAAAEGGDGGLADADDTGSQGRLGMSERSAECASGTGGVDDRPRPTDGMWRDADWLFCRDGKWRPVEPGTFPLAHGVSARVGRLRGYGNAIVPQVAAQFVIAFMEVQNG